MATQNQGNANLVYQGVPFYDDPFFAQRQSISLGTIAGSGGTSNKFLAYAAMTIYSVTFFPVTALGSSTYTVNGTQTTSAMSAYFVGVLNTNPLLAPVGLTTTTVGGASSGPFYIAGTGTMGTNVNVAGVGGFGGYTKYALNTLGGTNTAMPWGTTTYRSAVGGNAAGLGGLYLNPGDQFYVIAGTDATGTASCVLEFAYGQTAVVVA